MTGSRRAVVVLASGLLFGSCESGLTEPPDPYPTEFVAVAAGDEHTCATSTGGNTYCWGRADFSRLGHPGLDERCDDVGCIVPVAMGTSLPFETLSAGESHNCGLIDGQGYCWGFGRFGQLGDGGEVIEDCFVEPAFPCTHDPAPVSVGLPLDRITAARMHTCGLTADGRALCWGWNIAGQLGRGRKSDEAHFMPREVEGNLRFRHLDTGYGHTCGVSVDGTAYCWGASAQGRLGNGDVAERFVPTAVAGSRVFRQVAAGSSFSCGIATDGAVYCWGEGLSGRLGTGDGQDRLVPTRNLMPEPAVSLSAGHAHACAIAESGTLYCWGVNSTFQLGVGDQVSRSTPVAVPLPEAAIQVTTGIFHTCAITADRRLWCWGGNFRYQLGDGTVQSRSRPTPINPELDEPDDPR